MRLSTLHSDFFQVQVLWKWPSYWLSLQNSINFPLEKQGKWSQRQFVQYVSFLFEKKKKKERRVDSKSCWVLFVSMQCNFIRRRMVKGLRTVTFRWENATMLRRVYGFRHGRRRVSAESRFADSGRSVINDNCLLVLLASRFCERFAIFSLPIFPSMSQSRENFMRI